MSVEINNSVSIIADMNINANCRSEDEVDDVVSELLSVAPKANESEKDGNDGGTALFLLHVDKIIILKALIRSILGCKIYAVQLIMHFLVLQLRDEFCIINFEKFEK